MLGLAGEALLVNAIVRSSLDGEQDAILDSLGLEFLFGVQSTDNPNEVVEAVRNQ